MNRDQLLRRTLRAVLIADRHVLRGPLMYGSRANLEWGTAQGLARAVRVRELLDRVRTAQQEGSN